MSQQKQPKAMNKYVTTQEQRTLHATEMRIADGTADASGRTIEGYAFLYNNRTDMGWYQEVILPGAADGLIEISDVRALLNHNPNDLLARSKKGKGTLSLTLDERGLKFSFVCPECRSDIIEMLQRGDLDQCSFSFTIDQQRWIENGDESELREVVKFKELYDVTLATYPAYEDTTAALRCRNEALGVSQDATAQIQSKNQQRNRFLHELEIVIL